MGEEREPGILGRAAKAADAGGWEALADRETRQAITELAKIRPDQWREMKDTLNSLKDLLGIGTGSNIDLLSGIGDTFRDVLTTELEAALSPIKNEIIEGINMVLEPLMPNISEAVNNIASLIGTGIGAIEAFFTGKFDQWLLQLKLSMQEEVSAWNVEQSERMARVMAPVYKYLYGIDYEALDASALEGGLYSGQFDIDPSVFENFTLDIKDINIDFGG